MGKLERKKCKRLGINFLIVLVFFAQTFMVAGVSFSQSFLQGKYPLAYILDSYLFISLLANPILISSLVKKVIEIEEKIRCGRCRSSLEKGSTPFSWINLKTCLSGCFYCKSLRPWSSWSWPGGQTISI
ncbi:hypothetical protein HMPREF9130_0647 [Peptoniphilus sp. oral taxon 375 str. F0436]|nr:hypothetical protein HMPREF9130_0647 [Peptoniphilus sp. oral taxon 375 str. F0436]